MELAPQQIKQPILEFRNVAISFDQTEVLTDVNFKLMPGKIITLTGQHMTGKSVLLRLAIGLLSADRGEILIEGQHIETLTEQQLLTLRNDKIGLVFQESALFTSLTVYENAAFRLAERGWPDDQIEVAVDEILNFVNLADSKQKYWEELSGGMRRRLEIARALIGWPTLMLFDEPTAGLDPINTKSILNLILAARDLHNVSAIVVTKELREIDYLANHYVSAAANGSLIVHQSTQPSNTIDVMVLNAGKIAFFGKPVEFQHSCLASVLNLTHPKGNLPLENEIVDEAQTIALIA